MSVSSRDFLPRRIPLSLITIRPATLFDLNEIMRIERQSFREQYPRGLFLMFLEANRETFLVAEYNGQVIGYVMGYLKPDMEGHIMSIAVDPLYRGNGIGRALMEAVIDRLIKRGARYIGLEVRVSNQGAIKLYERLGFKKMKIIRRYYSDGEDAYYMMLTPESWGGKS
ncbi:ribosomal protein S18-alanine N-acetyltransferase [Thermococcus argininiproducens]|uniref:Ribosomal protein S18-alanine N-acetyltransferase n=1 Tax=Thermococcus argininiproducens TaxID=2866384 RepID=A0A9E7MAW9_9EURY|nr:MULTISPECIES: ribosomal protein S18-alanine N-acetyltransferase [Thermococcus]KPU63775.1 30S ribosomal protein S18 [Thermococcus sp. EP1]NJE25977.1 ribosomal-protein-alanine N-acetyltransferase [Thermococcus sp. MV5]USH00541.1 ribosomal protein S18-alanine N-acetyltransferase [Thermococcus argininiproducens]